jgi:two-component system sensor histidine kinase KdpD
MAESPEPDSPPAQAEPEEAQARRGRLKIFFGAASGVGKTYAMLLAGRERRTEGADVVVGLVETHGRREAASLLKGLPVLPRKVVEYRGATLREFDLDAALERRPSLILVDELAHANPPGARHPKRWQDVEELLDGGIDVYTTLNVQNLESLNDDVREIAGLRVRETVPDTVFERADEVELVDLPPGELLDRLKDGKVSPPDPAQRAAEGFFRKGNLMALRELALRQTASRVDAQMRDYREDHAIREVWQVGERILVCIGPTPLAERLVRAGKRFAVSLRAEWIVVYVETPDLQRLPPEQRNGVLRVLRLAEQLGAETATLSAPEMGGAIINFARERNIAKIVMGKPTRRGWKRWLLGSVVDTIIAEAHSINVYLLGSPRDGDGPEATEEDSSLFRKSPPPGINDSPAKRRWALLPRYGWSLAVTALCTLIAESMHGRFDLANLVMVYLVGVILVATRYGRGPSILASVLGVAAVDFLFVTPYFSFTVANAQYLVTLAGMLAAAMIASHLMATVRYQAKVASHRERRATALYAMSKELSASRSEEEIVSIAVLHIHGEFGCKNAVLFPDESGRIVHPPGKKLEQSLGGCDLEAAQWVHDHGEPAGLGTNTLDNAGATYFPLAAQGKPLGVLALQPANLRRIFLPEQRKLLETFIGQTAQAIERVRLAEQARAAAVQMEAESLRNSLLSSISHDLRAPLAAIVGAAGSLREEKPTPRPEDRRELIRSIHDQAVRMASLIDNILDMARLDAGAAQLKRHWHPLQEIVNAAVKRLGERLESHPVEIKLPPDLPLVYVDAAMIEQVLVNLLENAARYTPAGTPIDISAERSAFTFTVEVADRGPGIARGQEEQLFEKFHQGQREGVECGVGLGLPICRAIVEAHGGYIRARNRPKGGAVFALTLMQEQAPPAAAAEASPEPG